MKNKINYTVSSLHHPKMLTQYATLAYLHRQIDQGLFMKNLNFTKTKSKKKRGKTKSGLYYGR